MQARRHLYDSTFLTCKMQVLIFHKKKSAEIKMTPVSDAQEIHPWNVNWMMSCDYNLSSTWGCKSTFSPISPKTVSHEHSELLQSQPWLCNFPYLPSPGTITPPPAGIWSPHRTLRWHICASASKMEKTIMHLRPPLPCPEVWASACTDVYLQRISAPVSPGLWRRISEKPQD